VAGGAPKDALPAVFPEPVRVVAPQEEETKAIQQVVASLQAPPPEPAAATPQVEAPKVVPGAAARPSAPAQAGQRRLSLVHGGAGEPKAAPRAEEPQAAPVAAPETRAARTAEEPPAALSAEQLAEIISGLSAQIIEQVRAMDERQVIKLAGELAAKEMWQHEKSIRLSHGDPIDFWERSRAQIAAKLRLMGANSSAFAAGRA
jgi:hypothetical protein